MLTSLYTAVSGMNANGMALSVIGDNIANVNTVGFKGSGVAFGDIMSQTLTGISGTSQVGRGVLISAVTPLFTQGSFETTESALDLAIDGNGLFIVSDGSSNYYTRAGQFSLDKNGKIENTGGLILQGYLADASGTLTGNIGDLTVANKLSPANSTKTETIALNLDATSPIQTSSFTLDGNGDSSNDDPANYNYSTTVTVNDSQGNPHQVNLYFEKTADNAWTAHYVQADSANPDLLIEAGTQALTFDTNGSLINDNSATAINFNFGTAVLSPQAVTFDYGTGTGETPQGSGFDGTTQLAGSFSVMNIAQDGYSAGTLKNIAIGQDGTITGIFTNGQTRMIAQLALANFLAPDALAKLGSNLYAETAESGQAVIGAANTSGIGRVLSNTLELSNVDLAEQFVKMISTQRGFQANSRIITTTDELLTEIVNLKR